MYNKSSYKKDKKKYPISSINKNLSYNYRSGNTINPVVVRLKYVCSDEYGVPKTKYKVIDSFSDCEAAFDAIMQKKKSIDNQVRINSIVNSKGITFGQLNNQWLRDKTIKPLSPSRIRAYNAAMSHCQSIQNMNIYAINAEIIQKLMDQEYGHEQSKYGSRENLKTMIKQMYKFAKRNNFYNDSLEFIEDIDIGHNIRSRKHINFSENEIKKLWQHKDRDDVSIVLMMIFSGARPGEFLSVKKTDVDIANQCFYIQNGKNELAKRVVPIPDFMVEFYKKWLNTTGETLIVNKKNNPFNFTGNEHGFLRQVWNPALEAADVYTYRANNGQIENHIPHDVRHTFTTIWRAGDLKESYLYIIQGHATRDTSINTYTHIDPIKLVDEINKLYDYLNLD